MIVSLCNLNQAWKVFIIKYKKLIIFSFLLVFKMVLLRQLFSRRNYFNLFFIKIRHQLAKLTSSYKLNDKKNFSLENINLQSKLNRKPFLILTKCYFNFFIKDQGSHTKIDHTSLSPWRNYKKQRNYFSYLKKARIDFKLFFCSKYGLLEQLYLRKNNFLLTFCIK